MRLLWNRLLPPCCAHSCCCCDLAEAQELGLPVVGHPWVDGYLQLPDRPGFFDFATLTVVGDDGLQECNLLEV